MEDNSKQALKCAQQSQLLAHITELAASFKRPARDLVVQWFAKVQDKPEAMAVWEADAQRFHENVRLRSVEKKKEEKEDAAKGRENEENFVARSYKRPEDLEDEDAEFEQREAVPLIEAMKDMTLEERLAMAPGGLDPLEVFEALPEEFKKCFECQEVQALVDLQKTMDPAIFNPHLIKCIKAGLWSQPSGEEGEEFEEVDEQTGEVLPAKVEDTVD